MIKKAIFISYLMGFAILFAQNDIVLKDYSQNSTLTQNEIEGCLDKNIVVKQKKEIRALKKELNIVLRRLSKMEKEISTPKNKIKKIEPKIKGDYIIVRVKRGDTLSKYAKKYYGDKSKYYKIYRANKGRIGKDLKLNVGDRIVIPIKNKQKNHKTLKNIKKYNHSSKYYISTYNTSKKSSKPTYISTKNIKDKLKMLDEVVYIDENKNSNQEVIFIPLDEN